MHTHVQLYSAERQTQCGRALEHHEQNRLPSPHPPLLLLLLLNSLCQLFNFLLNSCSGKREKKSIIAAA